MMPTNGTYGGHGKAVVVTPSAALLCLIWINAPIAMYSLLSELSFSVRSRYQIFFPGTKGVASPVI
jgi:hypothetical protein